MQEMWKGICLMYGKLFASTFTGSMFGSGPEVFAVWAYVIAHTHKDSHIELNPKLLGCSIGCTDDVVKKTIEFLCAPDSNSRSKEFDGKRLIKEGEFLYQVINHKKYREIRNEDDRREYNRVKQSESRARRKLVKASVIDGQSKSVMSAHAEAEAEAEAEADKDRKTGKRADGLFPKTPDAEFYKTLCASSAYKGIDVERELLKIDLWLKTPKGRGRRKTCQFILNWMNRAEPTLPPESRRNASEIPDAKNAP